MKVQEYGMSVEDLISKAGLGKAETKANENIDVTQNSTWYNAYGVVAEIQDLAWKTGSLMSRLGAGYQGNDLPVSLPVPYNTTNYFMKGKTAWVDSARPVIANKQVTDESVTLTQTELILQMGITDKMIAHSTDKGLYDKVVGFLRTAATRSMEGMIINGDSEAGATGNVNSDDQAPATTYAADGGTLYHATLLDHGLRELAINGSLTDNTATFDADLLKTVIGKMGTQYQTRMGELLCLAAPATFSKMQTDDSLKLAANTSNPTIDGNGVSSIMPWGLEVIPHELVPLTEADGKVSATPGNNTKGQYIIFYKPAVIWGFGQDVKVEVERIQGYGFELTVTMEFGFVIADNTHTVAAGINGTV